MKISIELTQKQTISQSIIESMNILQMNAQELDSYIETLALENPVIDISDSQSGTDEYTNDLQRKLDWLESTDYQNRVYYEQDKAEDEGGAHWQDKRKSEETLSDYLNAQILLTPYSQKERTIIDYMIHSLDNRGYFTENIADTAEYFHVSKTLAEKLLNDIQNLDPAGVGAKDLKECLKLQLKRYKNHNEITMQIIDNHLDDMAKNHLPIIAKQLSASLEDVIDACDAIRELNPKPGSAFSSREHLHYISPDVVVVKLEKKFEILINEYQYPSFSINSYYRQMLSSTNDTETKKYLKDKITQAEWVQQCISQRTSTLSRVMHVLVEKQQDFFLYGVGHKRPMKLNDIACQLDLHESTVSRALHGKYLQCSWGIFSLNYFLTSVAIKSDQDTEDKTAEQIKTLISQIIDQEDKKKPLSDQKIAEKLAASHITISRRTVNKYRTEMNIPDKSGRKIW